MSNRPQRLQSLERMISASSLVSFGTVPLASLIIYKAFFRASTKPPFEHISLMYSSCSIPVFSPPPTPPLSKAFSRTSRNLLSVAFTLPAFAAIPNPTPLRRVPVRGDGRCLYRAIAKNLAHTEGRSLSENLERQDADALRNIAWKCICVDRTKEFVSRHVIEGSIRSYCSKMRNPMFYGGEAEMLALSDVLKLPIMVYLQDRGHLRNIATYGDKYNKSSKSHGERAIRLLYVNGNHYDALLHR